MVAIGEQLMSESYYQQFGVGEPTPPPEPTLPPGAPAHSTEDPYVPLHGVADPSELTDPHLPVVDARVGPGQQFGAAPGHQQAASGHQQLGPPPGQAPVFDARLAQGQQYGAVPDQFRNGADHFASSEQFAPSAQLDGFVPQQQGPRHGAQDHFVSGTYAPRQDARQRLQTADLVDQHKAVPTRGWRKAIHTVTRANVGLSKAERDWIELQGRTRRDLRGTFFTAIVTEKGGIGKTTTTVCLGCALAELRKDYVLAMDLNPASGTLYSRVDKPSQGNIRTLNADRKLASYSDAHYHMGLSTSSGLEILDGVRDTDVVLTGGEVQEAWRRANRFYPIGLGDCGTQLRDDVIAATLAMSDALVVVASTRIDGVRAAENTLVWLSEHGHEGLVRAGTVIINDPYRETDPKKVEKMKASFGKWVRKVHYIPFDPHLTEADTIDFGRLKGATRRAYIEAAASVVDLFAAAADKDYTGQPRAGLGRRGGEVV
ncbi:ESX-1 secretion-associated protein EspI [Mycobacteroides abscessus subsp. bolletii]|nr:ESX-1 secretion-associated protein EspI [Mycobacteroides abscessus subsp. bolletii]SKX37144.1 ESX-1 secretion-associated protein EspI [Mycobacteroides abscessus subsp. bolletii]